MELTTYSVLVALVAVSGVINGWVIWRWLRRKRKKRKLKRLRQQQEAELVAGRRFSGDASHVSADHIQTLHAVSVERTLRPEAWEDDISENTLDAAPFENSEPICVTPIADVLKRRGAMKLTAGIGSEALAGMIANDHLPIPSGSDREGYNSASDLDYWLGGLEDYLKVMEVARQYAVEPRSVLDFGCSSGRLVRHYVAQTEIPEIWGADINARHIRWLSEFLPDRVKPIANHCLPTLPIRDNSVDIVTAFSVFTHIDTFENCWLAELARILHDDGFAYLTVHNEDTWSLLRDQIDNPANRLVQSLLRIDPEIAEKLQQPLADRRSSYRFTQVGPYRAQVFHSNNYLRNVWGRFFKVEAILPEHHVRQTVVVLRKR
jgi:SAM-dependent methyltransferase